MPTLANRNNNPGNLRYVGQEGATQGEGGFAKFNTPDDGYAALMNDLQGKFTGNTKTGLGPKSTLVDFAKIYAPSNENDSAQYAANLANYIGARPDSTLEELHPNIGKVAEAIAMAEGYKGQSVPTGGVEIPQPEVVSTYAAQEEQAKTEQPGLIQSLAQGVAKPFLRTYETGKGILGGLIGGGQMLAGGIGQALGIGGEDLVKKGISQIEESTKGTPGEYGYFGKASPLGYTEEGQKMDEGKALQDVAGNALELASYGVGGGAGAGAIKQGFKQGLIQGAKTGAIGGAGAGALAGTGTSLQQQASEGRTDLIEAGAQGLLGGAIGAGTGGILGGLTGAVGSVMNKTVPSRIIEGRKKDIQIIVDEGTNKLKNVFSNAKSKKVDVVKRIAENDRYVPKVNPDGKIDSYDALTRLKEDITPIAKTERTYIEQNNAEIDFKQFQNEILENLKKYKAEGAGYNSKLSRVISDLKRYKKEYVKDGKIDLIALDDIKNAKYGIANWDNPDAQITDKLVARVSKDNIYKAVEKTLPEAEKGNLRGINRELEELYTTRDFLVQLGKSTVKKGKLGGYFAQTIGGMIGSHAGPVGTYVGSEVARGVHGKLMKGAIQTPKEIKIVPTKAEIVRKLEQANQSVKAPTSAANTTMSNSSNIAPIIPQKEVKLNPELRYIRKFKGR